MTDHAKLLGVDMNTPLPEPIKIHYEEGWRWRFADRAVYILGHLLVPFALVGIIILGGFLELLWVLFKPKFLQPHTSSTDNGWW